MYRINGGIDAGGLEARDEPSRAVPCHAVVSFLTRPPFAILRHDAGAARYTAIDPRPLLPIHATCSAPLRTPPAASAPATPESATAYPLCHRLLHVHLAVVVALGLEADGVHQPVREEVHELGVQDGDDTVYDTCW